MVTNALPDHLRRFPFMEPWIARRYRTRLPPPPEQAPVLCARRPA